VKASVFILGVIAALVAGFAVATVAGDIAGYVVAALLFVVAVSAFFVRPNALKGMLAVVIVALVGGLGIAAWGATTVVTALSDTSGPVTDPDTDDLAAADAKLDAIEDDVAFRLELTEAELRAYTLDALKDESDNPIEDITYDVRSGSSDNGGELAFEAELKSGGTTADGAVSAELVNGSVQIEIVEVGLGAFAVPELAEGAIEDLVERVGDFNTLLMERRADVQAINFTNDTVIIVGTQSGTDLITEDSFLTLFAEQAASIVSVTAVPEERYGPGVVDSMSAGSAPYYVALGDSLAANVGVDTPAEGYVSRLHNQLQILDGAGYGLRNFGITGETTGTMIRAGQLDQAVAFMEDSAVAYVTVNVGANNLLGHLGSGDCSQSLDDPACRERVSDAFATYPGDMELIFDAILEAAPDATVVFLTSYNPFNLGFGSEIEADMDRTLQEFNALAVGIARDRGIIVADGFGALDGTAAVTTHMLDTEPDIHPVGIGYDLLTGAILNALG
jgi:lysophospholipase L1-like esterase